MRAIVVSVWIFINLVFFGMCGYIYLLWTQYWHYITRQQLLVNGVRKIDNRPMVDYYQEQMPLEILNKQSQEYIRKNSTGNHSLNPRFRGHHRKKKPLDCPDCENSIFKRIATFKNRIVIRLRSVLHDESNVYLSKNDNPYNVNYSGFHKSTNIPASQLICRLKESVPKVRTLSGHEPAFKGSLLETVVPKLPLFNQNQHYNNCAIVTNAGALLGSNLGTLIDNHDLVLRFNHAPTEEYEVDVGAKTTIRILNSQVVSKKEFNFLTSKMYENVKLLVWDPCNYTSPLDVWRDKPEHDLFTPYVQHRRLKPYTNFHILDPRILWDLWNYLQSHTPIRIRKNPPSSGFLGLALLLPVCDWVRMFEYVPSVRMTSRCHYFGEELDSSCTFGVWHPLAAEKLLSLTLNQETDYVTFSGGYVSIPGYRLLSCNP